MSIFTAFIRPVVHKKKRDNLGLILTSKMTQERFRVICETETSSPATLCNDSAEIADWYKKIAGLVNPPEVLKKNRHASHM